MARKIHMLSTTRINALKERGFYADGGGLYLQVAPGGSKSWVFRFKENGRARDMGLGPLHTITLKEARDKATDCRKLRLDGIDPIEKRNAERAARQAETIKSVTFRQCAVEYIATHSDGWKNDRHRAQWPSSLEAYVYPVIGDLPVQAVDTALVLKVLQQSMNGSTFWKAKHETARRVRSRIELVINYATPQYRTGDNPASWKILKSKLGSRTEAIKAQPALPYVRMAEFMADLRQRRGISARALDFTILTASRSASARGAQWSEFDLEEKIWTVPAARMKGSKLKAREHRVPLCKSAVALLKNLRQTNKGKFVFPGGTGNSISDMSMTYVIRRMNAEAAKSGRPKYVDPRVGDREVVPHGFRATFKTWASEQTSFANEISEAALAHTSGDEVTRAHGGTYGRGDLFRKRQQLMQAWCEFCTKPARSADVVPINSRAR